MKKLNRVLSAAVAACMSLTMFAGAVELDSAANAPETETLTGTAYVYENGKYIENPFEYTVPTDATEDEKEELALLAAEKAANMMSLTRAGERNTIISESDVEIPSARSGNEACVESYRSLSFSGGTLEVLLKNITGCSSVNISIDNGSGMVWRDGIRVSAGEVSVLFVHDNSYTGGVLTLNRNADITAYLSGNVSGNAGRVRVIHSNS